MLLNQQTCVGNPPCAGLALHLGSQKDGNGEISNLSGFWQCHAVITSVYCNRQAVHTLVADNYPTLLLYLVMPAQHCKCPGRRELMPASVSHELVQKI